jgi:hypothetical protein
MRDILSVVAAAAVIASMASCSSETDFEGKTSQEDQVSTPVNFGSYLAQSKSTRAGEGETNTPANSSFMTTDLLKDKGFGVVAYYTGTSQYAAGQSTTEPNFMYNTKVSGENLGYSPVVYWPNGGQNQGSTPVEGAQYVSFFAYAPYKAVYVQGENSGKATDNATTGVTALSSNATNGDPTVSYTLGAIGADADLLWGTAGTNGSTTSGTEAQAGTTFTGGKAAVNANLSKMKVGGKVQFNFKHALAKFGGTGAGTDGKTSGLMVVADIDNGTATTGGTLNAAETKITVKSIKIESVIKGSDGNMATEASIPTSGTLNLATGEWTTSETNMGKIDYEITSPAATATDGATKQTLNEAIAEPASVSSWNDLSSVTGVTTTSQIVYTETTPLLIIPDGKNRTFRITIDYIVRTKNESLHKGYTEVEQSFYKDLTLNNVSLNAKYNLLIHLGLTSVKFDATVSTWDDTANGGTTSDTSTDKDPMVIDMPANVK